MMACVAEDCVCVAESVTWLLRGVNRWGAAGGAGRAGWAGWEEKYLTTPPPAVHRLTTASRDHLTSTETAG